MESANKATSESLGIEIGYPIAITKRVAYSDDEAPIEISFRVAQQRVILKSRAPNSVT